MKQKNNPFKSESKLVGGVIPRPLAELLSLYCLYSGTSRSKTVQRLITEELQKYKETDMLEDISRKLSGKLRGLVTSKRVKTLTDVRNYLHRKGISETHIDKIIRRTRELCKER